MTDEPSTAVWTVWRQGDDGNPDVVRRRVSKPEADRLVAEFESHGHKQLYWAEKELEPIRSREQSG